MIASVRSASLLFCSICLFGYGATAFAQSPKKGEGVAVAGPALDMKAFPPQNRGISVMPGIGTPAKTQMPTAQNIVPIGKGGNEVVYVGLGFLNRIATPFKKPRVIEASGITFETVGQDVYFMVDRDTPIGMFIADKSPNAASGAVAALTLIPKAGLPGQNIVLRVEGVNPQENALSNPGQADDVVAPPSDYVDGIRQLMVSFVQGHIPNGFQEADLAVGASRVGAVLVVPEKLYIGSVFNVHRYRVENASREPIELNETSFHEEGVRAVSFWRNARLAPGESTRVFIVSDRSLGEER